MQHSLTLGVPGTPFPRPSPSPFRVGVAKSRAGRVKEWVGVGETPALRGRGAAATQLQPPAQVGHTESFFKRSFETQRHQVI